MSLRYAFLLRFDIYVEPLDPLPQGYPGHSKRSGGFGLVAAGGRNSFNDPLLGD